MKTVSRISLCLTMSVVVVAALGCGAGPATVPLKGKVVHDSKPVNGGSLTFAPAETSGLAATSPVIASVGADGAFQTANGAAVGKYRVLYSAPAIPWEAPEWDGKGAPPQAPQSPYHGLSPKPAEIEVKSGGTEVTIELAK